MTSPLLSVKNVKKHFDVKRASIFDKRRTLKAVDDITFDLFPGETLGIVGESGCGKSTLAKTIARLYESNSGLITYNNQELTSFNSKKLKTVRRDIQYVFQDPYESLNPRHTIQAILEEPFIIHTDLNQSERQKKVMELLDKVGLPHSSLSKYPHEFSGGQRQRIGIARAIALKPKVLICDEPVSALDVSVQSQIINLLMDLKDELNLAILFIAHDLAVVKHISDRIMVMYLGKAVEIADTDQLFEQPSHPYTQFLIDAIPIPDPRKRGNRRRIEGELPSPISPPPGCRFQTRCPYKTDDCVKSHPNLISINDSHQAACYHYSEATKHWSNPWNS